MRLPEILLIDKPAGITSFDVIRQLRKKTGIKKFGHAGTLDPMATGLMIIGVEGGTKKLTEFIKLDKEYEAEIRIGEQRTTGDLDGEILNSVPSVILDASRITDGTELSISPSRSPVVRCSPMRISASYSLSSLINSVSFFVPPSTPIIMRPVAIGSSVPA